MTTCPRLQSLAGAVSLYPPSCVRSLMAHYINMALERDLSSPVRDSLLDAVERQVEEWRLENLRRIRSGAI